jgi:hypothetical protein
MEIHSAIARWESEGERSRKCNNLANDTASSSRSRRCATATILFRPAQQQQTLTTKVWTCTAGLRFSRWFITACCCWKNRAGPGGDQRMRSRTRSTRYGDRQARRGRCGFPTRRSRWWKIGRPHSGLFIARKAASPGCKCAKCLRRSGRSGCSLAGNCHRELRLLFALLLLPPGELGLLLVVGKLIVASHARIAFLLAVRPDPSHWGRDSVPRAEIASGRALLREDGVAR